VSRILRGGKRPRRWIDRLYATLLKFSLAAFANDLKPTTTIKLIVLFIGTYAGVCLLLAYISGWMKLATFYRSSQEVNEGQAFNFQSAWMRSIGFYNHCVTMTATANGIFISVWFLFRIGHSPLFVPWEDITVKRAKWLLGEMVELRFNKAPSIAFRISSNLYRNLCLKSS
jgi:hypothetical protein